MTAALHIATGKITPPRIGVPLLRRDRLLSEVRRGMSGKLLLISAEAGYGKTSLLLSALPDAAVPVAWLTLDESDADPHLFSAALVAAVRGVVPDFGSQDLDILTSGPALPELRRALFAALDTLPETVIVLDDFHTVAHHPETVRLVDELLASLPPSLHLVIATRTPPPLPSMARLLVQGQAAVLHSNALRFSDPEVTAFLRTSHGLDLAEPILRRLAQRTEGWPAALQLIALGVRARGLTDADVTPPELYAYLASAVLDTLDVEIRAFLLRTSILTELWPSICGVMTPEADPEAMLAEIERRNLFLYRLDEVEPRYRYHHLFAGFLRRRLQEEYGDGAVTRLHGDAARYLESVGILDEAVRHYFAAEALEEAERAMKPLHGDRLTARLAYTFRDLVMRLPEDVQNIHPWMTRCGASAARFVGDYQLGLTLARRALAASEGRDLDLWTFSIHGIGVMLGHLDRADEAAVLCEAALHSIPPDVEPRLKGGVISDLIDAYLQLGRLQDAARLLPSLEAIVLEGTQPGKSYGLAYFTGELALARMEYRRAIEQFTLSARVGEERGSLTIQLWSLLRILQAHVARDDLASARDVLERARRLHAQTGERASDLAFLHLNGDVARLAGDSDTATEHYRRTLAAVGTDESQEPRVWAQLGLAALATSGGQFAESQSLLLEAGQISERAHLFRLLPPIRLDQLSLLIHHKRHDEAQVVLAQLWDTMREWKSAPGAARCTLAAAHLHRASTNVDVAAPRRTGTVEADEDLRTALALPADVIEEILPYLRHEAQWTVPLIATGLRSEGDAERAQAILIAIGAPAVDHLIMLLAHAEVRHRAITMLGAIGDPRARRPLANLAAKRGTPDARAAQDAMQRLREPDPVTLAISMLGAFAVRRSGTAVSESEWKTKKVKTLFKYLVLHRQRAVPQEELIEVLWPEVGAETGAVRMKTAVKTLRQALEPLLEGTRSSFVVRVADTLRFIDPGRCRFDLDDYDRHRADGRGYEEAGRTVEAIAALERAAELYKGDLLEEDRYEEWSAPEREVRRERHLHLLESLADLHARRRDFRRAIETAQSILTLDRLREPAYRRIMRYALARGDRQTALLAYQTCERLLREELGVSTQPETRVLRDQARSSTPI